ncbi:MAG: ATP-dependent helicase C-terminal domain-containing protein, partial [bacterium]
FSNAPKLLINAHRHSNDLMTVARGRVPLVIHILAPNFRPVQITQDLANFWANDYPAVKKALQRRYPRHPWR